MANNMKKTKTKTCTHTMTKTETDALEFIEKKISYRFEIVDNSFTYLLRAIE